MSRNSQSPESAPIVPAAADGELDFGAVRRALWRKKLWVLVPAVIAGVLALAAVSVMAPRYKSETRIIVDGRESIFLRPEAERGSERERAVLDQEAIGSQIQLALSREVARKVIDELKLGELPEFDPARRGGPGFVRRMLILAGIANDPTRTSPEERVFESFYQRVRAYQIDRSRVIAIEFTSTDPVLAARVANAIAKNYVALLQASRLDQTRAAGQWLAGEIENLRARVAEAESRVESFRSKSNLFVGATNTSLSNQQLGEVTSQLALARSQKADADAKAQLIRDMLRSGRPAEYGEIINSELIRRLNEQRVTLRAQLAEQSSTLLGNHPRIRELRAQIADLERQIRGEAERLVRALENDATIAGARVEQLTRNLDLLKRQASSTNEQDVHLRALEREAKAQRDLLESYLAKYREATARDSLSASPADARVISPAIVSNTPYFPRKVPIVAIAFLGTLLLGAAFVITGELLAGGVYRAPWTVPAAYAHAPEATEPVQAADVAWRLPHAVTPAAPAPTVLPVRAEPMPDEPYTFARAADALRHQGNGHSRVAVIGLSPEVPTAAAATALARVLSGDGRAVVMHLVANPTDGAGVQGIAELVRGSASFGDIIRRDRVSRTHVIGAGQVEGDPAALIASDRVTATADALERTYEHVVLDLGCVPEIETEQLMRLASSVVLVPGEDMQAAVATIRQGLIDGGCRQVLVVSEPVAPEAAAA